MVEDTDEDFETMALIMREAGFVNPIIRCIDGESLRDYLGRQGQLGTSGSSPRPAMILLDLNLGGCDGRTLLREVKEDPKVKDIVVIVLSTSNSPRDIKICYQWGANGYAVKPIGIERLQRLVLGIQMCWLDTMEIAD